MNKYFVDPKKLFVAEVMLSSKGGFVKVLTKPDEKNYKIDRLTFKGTDKEFEETQKNMNDKFTNDTKVYENEIKDTEKKTVSFRYWDYNLNERIFKEARIVNPVSGTFDIDITLLQRLKIKYLLKDWDFTTTNEEGVETKIPLTFVNDGGVQCLSPESVSLFFSLDPDIVSEIIYQIDSVLILKEEVRKNL